jgi:hypothetical protein
MYILLIINPYWACSMLSETVPTTSVADRGKLGTKQFPDHPRPSSNFILVNMLTDHC